MWSFWDRNRNQNDADTKRIVKCTNPNISETDWTNTLLKLDEDIMELYDKAQDSGIIIISSPYNLKQIRSSLTEFTHANFKDASIMNCFKIVLDFLNPNKKYIEDSISESKSSDADSKFSIKKYDQLLQSCAIIVINTLNCDYISFPRFIRCLEKQTTTESWDKKIDFTGINEIGYLCTDGNIIKADILRQKPGKIFAHYKHSAGHYGKKYDWLTIPNDRICPPTERWKISWNQLDYENITFSSVNDSIFENISDKYFPSNFTISPKVYPIQDWSKKIDFENGKDIGILCDDGQVIRGTVLKKETKRIFVRISVLDNYSRSFVGTWFNGAEDWIHIPNERICPPPKIQDFIGHPFNLTGIPRSREEEDEDVKRAIAESLGQVYIPPQRHNNYYNQHTGTNMNYTSNNDARLQISEESFEPQQTVNFEEGVNLLLNGECCFGFYDSRKRIWRTAVFMKKWDNKTRIMIRYTQELNVNPSNGSGEFYTITKWPVNCISTDYTRFNVTERDLRDFSNVPKENIDAWVQRKRQSQ